MRFGAWLPVSVSALLCTGLSLAGPSTAAHQEDVAAGPPGRADSGGAGFVLATTRPGGPGMAPAFVGNGYLAGRQPFDGQGFAEVRLPGQADPLPTQSQVHGLYALGIPAAPPGCRRSRRWSAGPPCRPGRPCPTTTAAAPTRCREAQVAGYRQALDMHTGTLTTSLTWTSPAGRKVDLRYDVTPDRAHRRAAVVRLRIVPRFSGPVTVTDTLDGRAAELLDPKGTGHGSGRQWVDVASQGLGIRATEASTLVGGPVHAVPSGDPLTAKQAVDLDVRPGRTYTVTKYVGVATGSDSEHPHRRALIASRRRRGAWVPRPEARLGRGMGTTVALRHRGLGRRAAAAPGAGVVLRPAGQRPQRHPVGALAGRPLLRRIQRARLLGLRDVDVPVAAGHRAGHRPGEPAIPLRPPPGGPCQRDEDRRERGPVPVGECAARQRGDSGVRQDRAARDPRQCGHLARGAPVLAGDRRPALAGHPGLADAQGHRRLLRGPGDAERGWLLQHPRRHPA